jgi:hypothetical protein
MALPLLAAKEEVRIVLLDPWRWGR